MRRLKCNLCGTNFEKRGYLNQHLKITHGIQSQNLSCEFCGTSTQKSFFDQATLNTHKKSIHKPPRKHRKIKNTLGKVSKLVRKTDIKENAANEIIEIIEIIETVETVEVNNINTINYINNIDKCLMLPYSPDNILEYNAAIFGTDASKFVPPIDP